MKNTAAYARIYETIKNDIINEKYKIGDMLPTVPELEEMYGVSRTTIRKAEELLASEGYIHIQQGHGTTVIQKRINQRLNVLTSISQTLENRGYEVGTKNTFITIEPSTHKVARILNIEPGSPVAVINRIQTADKVPVAITKNYILRSKIPGIEESNVKIVSLYKYLNSNYGIVYTSAVDTISACTATYEDAVMLETTPGQALLTINRVCYIDDVPTEFDSVKLLADKYEFEVYLRG